MFRADIKGLSFAFFAVKILTAKFAKERKEGALASPTANEATAPRSSKRSTLEGLQSKKSR